MHTRATATGSVCARTGRRAAAAPAGGPARRGRPRPAISTWRGYLRSRQWRSRSRSAGPGRPARPTGGGRRARARRRRSAARPGAAGARGECGGAAAAGVRARRATRPTSSGSPRCSARRPTCVGCRPRSPATRRTSSACATPSAPNRARTCVACTATCWPATRPCGRVSSTTRRRWSAATTTSPRSATLLETSRVVSVVGPGGLGKTRMAHLVGRLAQQPVVHFVELAGVNAPEDVVPEVASALGVRDSVTGRRQPGAAADLRSRVAAAPGRAADAADPGQLRAPGRRGRVDLVAFLAATHRDRPAC